MPKASGQGPIAPVKTSESKPRFYSEFEGSQDFFVGVKDGPDGLPPTGNIAIGDITFPVVTKKVVQADGRVAADMIARHGDQLFLSLSAGEAGDFVSLVWSQVQDILNRVPNYWVQWAKTWDMERDDFRTARATVYSLLDHRFQQNPMNPLEPADLGPKARPGEDADILTKYLVMIPRDRLHEYGSREEINSLPSIADLDPALAEYPIKA
jgi:hypothetical protein